MRKTAILLALVLLAGLVHVSIAAAGGGFGGDVAQGKISGPAVGVDVVIDPTFGSPTLGRMSIRMQKGTSFSGATVLHRVAVLPAPNGWVLGCDGTLGAASPTAGAGLNVTTLTQLRFVNVRMRAYFPPSATDPSANVLGPIFSSLGITIDDVHNIPVITDVENAVCTQINDDGITKYVLSFSGTVQFEDSTK